ncbi:unnamed protein product [Prorocentrum cordatum]|uniref:Uncharacterized protein n=1 Tax=Prorocentrum cordatum TaxID=2364126 RepID=A0ABN9TH36_9DINO|nr:unnamed protein product [Polarella glacialis]
MARHSSALLPALLAAGLATLALRGSVCAFLPAPDAGRPATVAGLSAAVAAALAPRAAVAELPPLEDLPLDEMSKTREYGPSTDTFLGVSFPVALGALLFAVSWAAFWVTNSKPAKDEEGMYKTYIGGGELPPEGYTNPLDPRLSEDYKIEDDDTPAGEKKVLKKPASSAIV